MQKEGVCLYFFFNEVPCPPILPGQMEPSKVQANEQQEQPREQFQYMIGGVPVLFPCKPYPSQIAMMAKVSIQLTHVHGVVHTSTVHSEVNVRPSLKLVQAQVQVQAQIQVPMGIKAILMTISCIIRRSLRSYCAFDVLALRGLQNGECNEYIKGTVTLSIIIN